MQLIQNVSLKTNVEKGECDYSLSSFQFPLTYLRFGECVPISDITEIQLRVYTIEEKVLIDACELS